ARVGFGVHWASRYAINSSCLLATALLVLASRHAWGARASWIALAATAIGSLTLSWAIWPDAATHAFKGSLLASPQPDSREVVVEPYVGTYYPYPKVARRLLAEAERHRIYDVPDVPVFAAQLRSSSAPPLPARTAGALETVVVSGTRVVAEGWTEVPATVRGRVFTAHSRVIPRSSSLAIVGRADIAVITRRADLLLAGFRWEGAFDSEAQARDAARELCLVVEAPGLQPAGVQRGEACG
ncbi:MAG TPA: hypothetical protein VFV90_08365, partial [Usitatibacter sp.]|nr:hypothetical protein [Usitatibacter sp.]